MRLQKKVQFPFGEKSSNKTVFAVLCAAHKLDLLVWDQLRTQMVLLISCLIFPVAADADETKLCNDSFVDTTTPTQVNFIILQMSDLFSHSALEM